MGSQALAGTSLLTEPDHSEGTLQMNEHTLGRCLLVWWGVAMKDIVAGSPREILPAVSVYRTGGETLAKWVVWKMFWKTFGDIQGA